MNESELHNELERNKTEKTIIKEELIASQRKWADYVLSHKDEINSIHKPIVVKKKKSARIDDFLKKIKIILGFAKQEGDTDGTEAYI